MCLTYLERKFYGIKFASHLISYEEFHKLTKGYNDLLHYNSEYNIICLKPGSISYHNKLVNLIASDTIEWMTTNKIVPLHRYDLPEMSPEDYNRLQDLCEKLPQPVRYGWYKIISIV